MTGWSVSKQNADSGGGSVPVVPVVRNGLRLLSIHFAVSGTGSSDWHYLYRNGDSHPLLPSSRIIDWWGKGAKIDSPEWESGRAEASNFRACFERNKAVAFKLKLSMQTTRDTPVEITVTPTLDGSTSHLQAATVQFTYPANQGEHEVAIALEGVMPDEVGRYRLRLGWVASGTGVTYNGPAETRHRIYGIYGPPLEPDYDTASVADRGRQASASDGTVSGTRKRFDHMMRLIGGSIMRHPCATESDLVDLYWQLHKGINDTPGAAPYFDAGHNKHITTNGQSSGGNNIPIADQWLAFIQNSRNWTEPSSTQVHTDPWNDASCIGHVQIAKTMLAAVGLFARRTWVFPSTNQMPDGSNVTLTDSQLFSLGAIGNSARQTWTFRHNGRNYRASPKLMEPNLAWENFEACMLSPTGKFLTGGYNTSSNPASFRRNKGFNSAAELLAWWSGTRRGRFQRFMCWIYYSRTTNEFHAWDVDGNHFDAASIEDIRRNGKQLPPPVTT